MDSNAISVGYAIQNGTVLQKCGNHWCRIGTSQVVNSNLVNNTATNVVAINSTQTGADCHSVFTTWNNSSGNNIRNGTCNKAPNGLWYDNCEGGFNNYYDASSYCSSKGMRLPALNETTKASSSYISMCNSGFTWTSSANGYNGCYYFMIFNSSSSLASCHWNTYEQKCVK